jgi:hypothetical protein
VCFVLFVVFVFRADSIIVIIARALGVSGRAALCALASATYCEREDRIL